MGNKSSLDRGINGIFIVLLSKQLGKEAISFVRQRGFALHLLAGKSVRSYHLCVFAHTSQCIFIIFSLHPIVSCDDRINLQNFHKIQHSYLLSVFPEMRCLSSEAS